MKSYTYLLLLLIIPLYSCDNASDEAEDIIDIATDGDEEETPVLYSYYSLTTGDNWQYDVTLDENEPTQDELEVTGPVTINGEVYTDLEASVESTGFMTNLFANGALAEANGILRYTGEVTVPLDAQNEVTLEIPVIKLYDEAVQIAGNPVDQVTQTITQEIDGVPVTIDAVISTTSGSTVENLVVNDILFPRVIKATFTVNATITATILGVDIAILPAQDVIIANNTYAENVGLVNSDLNFQYEFIDLTPFGVELPFPQSTENFINQIITTYEVAADD